MQTRSDEDGEPMAKDFDMEVVDTVEREIYSLVFKSSEEARHRRCFVRLRAGRYQVFTRIGRTYIPDKVRIAGTASVVCVEQVDGCEPRYRAVCNAIGDIGGVKRSTTSLKLSPEVDDMEAIRHIVDECIDGVLEVFSWNEPDEQASIAEAFAGARESLLSNVAEALQE